MKLKQHPEGVPRNLPRSSQESRRDYVSVMCHSFVIEREARQAIAPGERSEPGESGLKTIQSPPERAKGSVASFRRLRWFMTSISAGSLYSPTATVLTACCAGLIEPMMELPETKG